MRLRLWTDYFFAFHSVNLKWTVFSRTHLIGIDRKGIKWYHMSHVASRSIANSRFPGRVNFKCPVTDCRKQRRRLLNTICVHTNARFRALDAWNNEQFTISDRHFTVDLATQHEWVECVVSALVWEKVADQRCYKSMETHISNGITGGLLFINIFIHSFKRLDALRALCRRPIVNRDTSSNFILLFFVFGWKPLGHAVVFGDVTHTKIVFDVNGLD